MEITIYRHPGYFGRSLPLDIFANEQKVASILSGTSLKVIIPDGDVTLRVEMGGAVSSPRLRVLDATTRRLECGTPVWVFFDVASLCYLPFLRKRVFYLREVSQLPSTGL